MPTIDVPEFAAEVEALALRFESSELPGLLAKRLEVPPGTVALVRDSDGAERVVKAGEQASGGFACVLVKGHDQAVSFQAQRLKTRQGRETQAGVELLLRLPTREIDVKALAGTLLADRRRLTVDELRTYLAPAVSAGLAAFCRERSAEQLMLEDPRDELSSLLRAELEGAVFSAGLQLLEVRHPSFYCEEFEQLRRARLEALDEEEELRRSERLQELKSRLERNEVLKRQEVEEFAKLLQYQGILKELSLKREVDRQRKEEELRRFEAIHNQVGKDDLKALIFLLEDDRLKAQLIQQLIERDMTEEQLRARKASDLERVFEERLADFSQSMETLAGKRSQRIQERGARTRRLYAVLGKQALAWDPRTNVRREQPKEVYDFKDGGLGYVRSVRVAKTRTGWLLLVGAQGGVYVVPEGRPGSEAKELQFASTPRGQGGVNAAAYFDGWVYASHSELGIWRWDLDGIVRPEPMFQQVTGRNDATRGVCVSNDGKLYFSSGPDLYRHDLVRPDQPLTAFRGIGDSVTAFVETQDGLFAGTRGGRVLRWSQGDPGSPRELSIRKANPIYMLRVAEIDGEPHLLVGAKEHGLTAVALDTGRAMDYRATDQIRWVDGATDRVYGVTRGGYGIHVWDTGRLEHVLFTIHTADRIQDIVLAKEPMDEPA